MRQLGVSCALYMQLGAGARHTDIIIEIRKKEGATHLQNGVT